MIGRMFLYMTFGLTAFFSGVLGLWVADRQPPVTGIVSKTLNNDVGPGQIVKIQISAYRIRSCKTTIERYIHDSSNTRYQYPDTDYLDPGPPGPAMTIIELEIPPRTNPGLATLKTNAAWECNPIHKIWPIVDRQPDIGILVTDRK